MKPSLWSAIASDTIAALTMLAALPETMRDVIPMLPPDWKPWVAFIGLCATITLRLVKRYQEIREAPKKR